MRPLNNPAARALFERELGGGDTSTLSVEDLRERLEFLVQPKRFAIWLFLVDRYPVACTRVEIAAAIGNGWDQFNHHLTPMVKRRILLSSRDRQKTIKYKANPALVEHVRQLFAIER